MNFSVDQASSRLYRRLKEQRLRALVEADEQKISERMKQTDYEEYKWFYEFENAMKLPPGPDQREQIIAGMYTVYVFESILLRNANELVLRGIFL